MTTPLQDYVDGLASVLIDDLSVQSALSTYNGRAAVYNGDKRPEDTDYPYAIVWPPSSDSFVNEFSNKKTAPTAPNSKIHVWGRKGESSVSLNKAADAVYNALHEQDEKLSNQMSTLTCLMLNCSAPVIGTEGDGTVSRVVNVSANLSKI